MHERHSEQRRHIVELAADDESAGGVGHGPGDSESSDPGEPSRSRGHSNRDGLRHPTLEGMELRLPRRLKGVDNIQERVSQGFGLIGRSKSLHACNAASTVPVAKKEPDISDK